MENKIECPEKARYGRCYIKGCGYCSKVRPMTSHLDKGCCGKCQFRRKNWRIDGVECSNKDCPCHTPSLDKKGEEWSQVLLRLEEMLHDDGDERYGRVKHRNTLVQNAFDELRDLIPSLLLKQKEDLAAKIENEMRAANWEEQNIVEIASLIRNTK